ncbi:MAG: rhamnulokinase [Bacteroidales bacterium]
MAVQQYMAFDFGAESGRAILGSLKDEKITLEQVHRFPTTMVKVRDHLHWNIFRFFEEMQVSLRICINEFKGNPVSVGIDTWGVDFGLLAEDGSILGLPYGYRDSRTDGMMEEFFKLVPSEEVYNLTGIQFMQLNTIFQLFAMKYYNSPLLKIARDLLFMPDIFNYLFTGRKATDFTYATTSQLFNPVKMNWEEKLFKAMDLTMDMMQDVVSPGTVIGNLSKYIAQSTGANEIPFVAVASHDTGSAIAAIPAEGKNWAYISSGTWSLMGIESTRPIINEKSCNLNLTNEGGVENTFRVLKNIMGLWLIQQCKAAWSSENYSYPGLVKMAREAKPFSAMLDTDDNDFLNPEDMPSAIRNYCKKTGQQIPSGHAEIARVIFESLAMKYRYTLDQLNEVAPEPIEKLYIIGGGVQNELLCQFTANACGIPVITGPAEGTALGNLLVQAMAMGDVKNLANLRAVVRNSFDSNTYEPQNTGIWVNEYEKFKNLMSRT